MAIEKKMYVSPTDADIVDGVYQGNRKMGDALFERCYKYFNECFHPVNNVSEFDRDDILQNSLETLLMKIENKRIYVEDGILKGKGGKPFTGKLTTFFMGIAYLKYKEFFREPPVQRWIDIDTAKIRSLITDTELYKDFLYGDEEDVILPIIADCISKISERCNEILTKFYYEKKNLDTIQKEIPTYKSKDALKNEKSRCLNTLRKSVKAIYNNYFN